MPNFRKILGLSRSRIFLELGKGLGFLENSWIFQEFGPGRNFFILGVGFCDSWEKFHGGDGFLAR